MTTQQIQSSQNLGAAYANDNYSHIYQSGMTIGEFAVAALENYQDNADAFGSERVPEQCEADFLLGAKTAFKG